MADQAQDSNPRARPQDGAGPAPPTRSRPGAQADPKRSARPANELSATEAALRAARQVAELTGRDPEAVVAIERAEHGWRVGVEVVETRRVPDSADILAVYDTRLDDHGELLCYQRARRYARGRTLHEEPR